MIEDNKTNIEDRTSHIRGILVKEEVKLSNPSDLQGMHVYRIEMSCRPEELEVRCVGD